MQIKSKLLEFVERAKERKVNDDRAKEELASIMDMLTDVIPDEVSGYKTDKAFHAVISYEDGDIDSNYFRFCLKQGVVVVCVPHHCSDNTGMEVYCLKDFDSSYIEDFTYINFEQLVIVFEEFVEKLSSMPTFENELKTLAEINNAIKEIINKNKKDSKE